MKTAFLLVFAAWLISLVIFLVWVIGRVIHRSEPDPEEDNSKDLHEKAKHHLYEGAIPDYAIHLDGKSECRFEGNTVSHDQKLHDFNDSCDFELDNCQACNGARGGVRGNENVIDGVVLCDYCSVDYSASFEPTDKKV